MLFVYRSAAPTTPLVTMIWVFHCRLKVIRRPVDSRSVLFFSHKYIFVKATSRLVYHDADADEKKAFVDLRDMVASLRTELQEVKAANAAKDENSEKPNAQAAFTERLDKFEATLGQVLFGLYVFDRTLMEADTQLVCVSQHL